MTTLYLRPVDDEGRLGTAIGSAELDGDQVVYEGSRVLRLQLEAIEFRFGIPAAEAFERLARDGWSNGKLSIGTDAQ